MVLTGENPPATDILIVDDSTTSLQVLSRMLQGAGYRVSTASSGRFALRAMELTPPRLVLLDVQMPDLDGLALCRRLKEGLETGDIPVIFISALDDEQDILRGFEAGGVDYIAKPFRHAEVLARVSTHLELATMQRNLETRVRERTVELEAVNRSLRAGEARYRRLVESLEQSYVIYSCSDDRGYDYISPSVRNVLGYPPEEIAARHRELLTDDPVNEEALRRRRAGLHGERQPPYEIEYHRRDGSPCRMEVAEIPVLDVDGSVFEVEGIARDITEQRRIEGELTRYRGQLEQMVRDRTERLRREIGQRAQAYEDLARSEARLREAQRIAHLGNWEWNISDNRIEWSDEVCRIFGLEPERFTATYEAFMRSVHPEDRAVVRDAVDRALEKTVPYEIVHRIVPPDGVERVVHERAEVTFDGEGEPLRMVGTTQDVTAQKRVEEQLRESEQRFRSTFEQAAVGIAHVAHDGHFLRANRKLCEILGYPLEELLTKTCKEITHPEDLEVTSDYIQKVDRDEPRSPSLEKRYRRKDGAVVWTNLTTSAVREPGGRFKYFISVVEDIGDRKQLEELMLQHQAMLAQVDRVSLMGEMASAIAHEINQPLAAISNYAGGAIQRLRAAGDECALRGALEQIAMLAERAGRIIQRLRDFVRGRRSVRELLDFNEVVANSLRMVEAQARRHGVDMKARPDPTLPRILGDAIQLEQVVINLLLNGVEAMRETAVGSRRLTVTTRRSGPGLIECRIQDSGPGLEPDILERMFEPFVTTKDEGTGMGLSISQSIVVAHGGRLWAEPAAEQGTVFRITLPVSAEDEG